MDKQTLRTRLAQQEERRFELFLLNEARDKFRESFEVLRQIIQPLAENSEPRIRLEALGSQLTTATEETVGLVWKLFNQQNEILATYLQIRNIRLAWLLPSRGKRRAQFLQLIEEMQVELEQLTQEVQRSSAEYSRLARQFDLLKDQLTELE